MMVKRRIATLEKTWPRRRSAADVDREARSIAQRTGTTYIEAVERLLAAVTDEELDHMIAEVGPDPRGGHQRIGSNDPRAHCQEDAYHVESPKAP
jgi:hypothetical protein